MPPYHPPTEEMLALLDEVLSAERHLAALPGLDGPLLPLLRDILPEAGRLAAGVLAPLNRIGDEEGCRLQNGTVHMPRGFDAAYQAFTEGGWGGLLIATVLMAIMYTCMVFALAGMSSALPAAGGGYTFARRALCLLYTSPSPRDS